jgi:type II secretory pathway component PulF
MGYSVLTSYKGGMFSLIFSFPFRLVSLSMLDRWQSLYCCWAQLLVVVHLLIFILIIMRFDIYCSSEDIMRAWRSIMLKLPIIGASILTIASSPYTLTHISNIY